MGNLGLIVHLCQTLLVFCVISASFLFCFYSVVKAPFLEFPLLISVFLGEFVFCSVLLIILYPIRKKEIAKQPYVTRMNRGCLSFSLYGCVVPPTCFYVVGFMFAHYIVLPNGDLTYPFLLVLLLLTVLLPYLCYRTDIYIESSTNIKTEPIRRFISLPLLTLSFSLLIGFGVFTHVVYAPGFEKIIATGDR